MATSETNGFRTSSHAAKLTALIRRGKAPAWSNFGVPFCFGLSTPRALHLHRPRSNSLIAILQPAAAAAAAAAAGALEGRTGWPAAAGR